MLQLFTPLVAALATCVLYTITCIIGFVHDTVIPPHPCVSFVCHLQHGNSLPLLLSPHHSLLSLFPSTLWHQIDQYLMSRLNGIERFCVWANV